MAKAKRKALSKKDRFEVFKRDSFTCQYCGKKAPDVVLHIDHIEPVCDGGTNDFLNLVTSCRDCNSGKSNRKLTDTSVVDKQRKQLEELQEKKEQLDMMFQWQKSLIEIEKDTVQRASDYWTEIVTGYHLNKNGEAELKRLINKFGVHEVLESMKIAAETYLELKENEFTKDSVEKAWKKVGGVCSCRQKGYDPKFTQIYYVRGILRNRVYVNEKYIIPLLKKAYEVGVCMDSITNLAKNCKNWTEFKIWVEDETEAMLRTD